MFEMVKKFAPDFFKFLTSRFGWIKHTNRILILFGKPETTDCAIENGISFMNFLQIFFPFGLQICIGKMIGRGILILRNSRSFLLFLGIGMQRFLNTEF